MTPPTTMTALREVVDWESLPEAERETIQTIGSLIVEGYSKSQIATRLEIPETQVAAQIDSLKETLLSSSGELEGRLRERVETLRRRTSTA